MTARPGAPRAARMVTEACSPAVVVLLLPLAVAWHATGYRPGVTLLWGLVVAVFSSVLPMLFIVRGARRGRWDGHHVRNREGRLMPLLLSLASTTAGLAILLSGRAPRDVIALNAAMVASLIACAVITQWWKISLHMAVAGGANATLVLIYGAFLLLILPIVILIGWSRVALRDHTIAQVVAGGVVGPLVGGAVFLLVR